MACIRQRSDRAISPRPVRSRETARIRIQRRPRRLPAEAILPSRFVGPEKGNRMPAMFHHRGDAMKRFQSEVAMEG